MKACGIYIWNRAPHPNTDLHDYLGWNGVANRSNINISPPSPCNVYKIYYEVYHVGKINKWYKQTLDKYVVSTGNVPKTFRGPFVTMQNMHDDNIENQVSLNYHKANLSTIKHFYETYDEQGVPDSWFCEFCPSINTLNRKAPLRGFEQFSPEYDPKFAQNSLSCISKRVSKYQ